MIPDFKTFVGESVWADIHRRSNGTQERKEDDLSYINDMTVDDFMQFLTNEYPSTPEGKNTFISRWDISNIIGFPIIIKDGIPISIFLYNCMKGKKWIGINSSFEKYYPDIISIIEKKYKTEQENEESIKIYKDDPNEDITNLDFIKLIDYLLNNITHHTIARKKRVNESVWADIHKRSIGDATRKEDDINQLDRDGFFDYLLDHFEYIGEADQDMYGPGKSQRCLSLSIPCYQYGYMVYSLLYVFDDKLKRFLSISPFEGKYIMISYIKIQDVEPDIFKKLRENYDIEEVYDQRGFERIVKYLNITPKDGSELTNKFFLEVIDFINDNIEEPLKKVFVRK